MIGVFDSGLGGLTVLSEFHSIYPSVPMLYVADQAFAPYGNLSADCVLARSQKITEWLTGQGCKLIIIACNTATAIAIDELRQHIDIPLVGVEPGVKPAALQSVSQKIAILATDNTLASSRYKALLQRFLPDVEIISQGCCGLADAIEQGSDEVDSLLEAYCQPLLAAGVDQLVLGCTHYPLVSGRIAEICGDSISIVDTSEAIALEAGRRYREADNTGGVSGGIQLFTTGGDNRLKPLLRRYSQLNILIGYPVSSLSL